jgi:hypothetical protein
MTAIGSGKVAGARRAASSPVFAGCLCLLLTFLVQLWFYTPELNWSWPLASRYFPIMADAFLHGQVSMRPRPSPQLLALRDPYDPIANKPYRWHDATLYDGKFYLYWGPVPGLATAAVSLALRIDPLKLNDQMILLVATMGMTAVVIALTYRLCAAVFPGAGAWEAAIPALAFGLSTPVLKAMNVYGASIASAQFFLLAGILAAWTGLSGERRLIWLTTAGICWTLSVGSRVSLAPAVGVVALLTFWRAGLGTSRRHWMAGFLAVFIPLLLGGVGLADYNYERFGSIWESGWKYQLSGENEHALPMSDLISYRYIPANLLNYLIPPPTLQSKYPYVQARSWQWGADFFKLGKPYHIEPVSGFLWTQPLLLLALFRTKMRPMDAWLCSCLWAAAVIGIVPSLMVWAVTLRFSMDAFPCLSILAAIGYFRLLSVSGEKHKWVTRGALLVLLVQVVIAANLAVRPSA